MGEVGWGDGWSAAYDGWRTDGSMKIKKITRLHKLALKAAVARDKFEQALAKAQRERNWVDICIAEGIDPQANAGDWMC
jgi:hypothetical protein